MSRRYNGNNRGGNYRRETNYPPNNSNYGYNNRHYDDGYYGTPYNQQFNGPHNTQFENQYKTQYRNEYNNLSYNKNSNASTYSYQQQYIYPQHDNVHSQRNDFHSHPNTNDYRHSSSTMELGTSRNNLNNNRYVNQNNSSLSTHTSSSLQRDDTRAPRVPSHSPPPLKVKPPQINDKRFQLPVIPKPSHTLPSSLNVITKPDRIANENSNFPSSANLQHENSTEGINDDTKLIGLEQNNRKNKILEWQNKKKTTNNGSIKKKSLMKFNKKSNKKNIRPLLTNINKSPIVEDDQDIVGNVHPLNEINPLDILDTNEEKLSKTEEFKVMERDDDENIDLDSILSNLQNKEIKNAKKMNVIDDYADSADIETPIDAEITGTEEENAEKLLKIISEKNKKDVPEHEFSTETFVKKFYKTSDLIKSFTDEEVKKLREYDSVNIKGKNVLNPILEWSHLGFPSSIYSVLQKLKFDSPTPIQCEALPHIMDGNDFIGIAKTGSGKTIAFLLPLFRQLLSNESIKDHNYPGSIPRAIIITPTRELALQIAKTAKPFADSLNLKICKCYGGQSISKQISDLKAKADIIIGTPGRIIDLLCTNSGRILKLSNVTYLVMDEADRMFDMGFEPQILKILKVIRPDRQTVLFSATFPPKIQSLARKILNDPIEVLIGSKNLVNENIEQHFEVVPDSDSKFSKLLQILGAKYNEKNGKVLIFMERQDGCDKMVRKLLSRGYAVMSLHGGKDQNERGGTIKDFKNGIIDIIIATSIASRGLDVDNLNLVINYDAPSHIEDYVHRVGRTGRGGKSGEAYTILTPDQEKCASDLVRVLKASKQEIPTNLVEMAENFESKIKGGDVKFSSGFGGKGLEKLQAIRDNNETIEKQIYLKDNGGENDENGKSNVDSNLDSNNVNGFGLDVLKNFKVEYSTEARGLDATSYHAKLNVNDLPSTTRWFVTTHENYLRVIELTGASVTTKGRYYPPGQEPKAGEDPKLYVLVEGPNEVSVSRAVALFKENVLRGLERETFSSEERGKYSIV